MASIDTPLVQLARDLIDIDSDLFCYVLDTIIVGFGDQGKNDRREEKCKYHAVTLLMTL